MLTFLPEIENSAPIVFTRTFFITHKGYYLSWASPENSSETKYTQLFRLIKSGEVHKK